MLMRVLFRSIAGAALLLAVTMAPLRAQDTALRVIVHAGNPVTSLLRAELSDFFLKKVAAWKGGSPVVPVDQTESNDVRKLFSKRVLGRDVQAVKGYWQQAIFAGKNFPPLEKASDAEVAAFVAANPNAIGYVSVGAVLPGTVKVIRVDE
jgi:ABC-type phosphate transport system substrate-binding protein